MCHLAEGICDAGWIGVDNECYRYYQNNSGLTFSEAQQNCLNEQNSYLAQIKSSQVQTTIDNLSNFSFN